MNKTAEAVPFFKDRLMTTLVALDGFIVVLVVVSVFARLRSHDFKVPVQYVVNDGSILQTSQWFTLYSLALFAVIAGISTVILAQRIHKSERWYAAAALILLAVTTFFGFLMTNALLGLVSQV
ncbi:hypothetical protein KBD20_02285 [Candidatus Saccharibacteria bacterium]|nr:hypothetical protein [Candidatus Saccharibacteria bacterium]